MEWYPFGYNLWRASQKPPFLFMRAFDMRLIVVELIPVMSVIAS